jgi:hypothetical protein
VYPVDLQVASTDLHAASSETLSQRFYEIVVKAKDESSQRHKMPYSWKGDIATSLTMLSSDNADVVENAKMVDVV